MSVAIPVRTIVLTTVFLTGVGCSTDCDIPRIDINASEISWESKGPCTFGYKHCNDSFLVNAKVKFRGGMSSQYDKHSYTVKLPEGYAIGGMPSDNDWIINASYIDKTFMRHKLSFDLFRNMNEQNIAPRSGYAEVYQNGLYQGLYVLMERLDATRLDIDKKDTTSFIFKDPPLLYADVLPFDRDSLYRESQKYPNLHKEERSGELKKLEDLIFRSSDLNFTDSVFHFLDSENLIDWKIILLLANNSDGQLKNYFIYRTDSTSHLKIAIWDYDHSFGRDGDNEYNMLDRLIDERRVHLFKRLFELNPANFESRLAQRWKDLRQRWLDPAYFFHQIKEIDQTIRPHIEANAARWPDVADWYYDDNNYLEELDILYEFIPRRIEQLDERFGHEE